MAKVTAGVDLGGTKIQTAVLSGRKIVGSARVLTPQTGAPDVIAAIAETVRTSLEQAGATPKDLDGVGIGTPGEIDAADGVVSLAANVPGFTQPVPLGPEVSRSLGKMWYAFDSIVIPTNIVIDNAAIISMVAAAFFDSGGLKAGTPFDTASTPVIAVQPLENEVSSRKIESGAPID